MSDQSLRAALEDLAEWLRDELKTGVPVSVVDAPEAFELAAGKIDAALGAHPAESVPATEWTEEERGFVETALAAADAGNAGHWPTVAAYLAAEVRRLRAESVPVADRERVAEVLKATLAELEGTPCSFWACKGPDVEPEDMVTCSVCLTIRDLRSLLAAGVFRSEAVALDREAALDAVYEDLIEALHPWRDYMAVEDVSVIANGVVDVALKLARPEAVVKAEARQQTAQSIREEVVDEAIDGFIQLTAVIRICEEAGR